MKAFISFKGNLVEEILWPFGQVILTRFLSQEGVIERSDAAYYSHPVIVTKSRDKFRTCIDYRPLNRCLKPASFPLHNIKHSFERIGNKKPDVFGVMDLIADYHQAPLHPNPPRTSHFYGIHMLCGSLSVYETVLWSVSSPLLL